MPLIPCRSGDHPRFDRAPHPVDSQRGPIQVPEGRFLGQLSAAGADRCFGKGWFDVDVWRYNHLKYEEQDGDWQAKVYVG